MIDLEFKYKNLLEYFGTIKEFSPKIAIILGSGLGDFVSSVKILKTINTSGIPQYPISTVPGHSGKIHFAEVNGISVLLFQGRIHFYEGYSIDQCILPAFISNHLGCKYLLITNAAGGINEKFSPGDLMLVNSFIGINIKTEMSNLLGLPSTKTKNDFLNFPSVNFNKKIRIAASRLKIKLHEGIYWYNKGPVYETPAEIKMAKKLGADAVGMSTIPEAIFAAVSRIETSTISCITNFAAGISNQKLNHTEVTDNAAKAADNFSLLINTTLKIID